MAWFLYDFCLTFPDEVNLIWGHRPTWTVVLYFIIRYFTMALLSTSLTFFAVEGMSKDGCSIFSWVSASGTFLLIILVDVILQFRIYVMYSRSRRVAFINAVIFAFAIAGSAGLAGTLFPKPIPLPEDAIGSCYTYRSPGLAAIWLPPLAFDCYLALLAVLKYRECREKFIGQSVQLMHLLALDNVIYFTLVSCSLLTVMFIWLFERVTPASASVSLIHAAGAVGGSRLVLSLRKAMISQHAATAMPSTEDNALAMDHLRSIRSGPTRRYLRWNAVVKPSQSL